MESFVREYLIGGVVLAGVLIKLAMTLARLSAAETRVKRVRMALASLSNR